MDAHRLHRFWLVDCLPSVWVDLILLQRGMRILRMEFLITGWMALRNRPGISRLTLDAMRTAWAPLLLMSRWIRFIASYIQKRLMRGRGRIWR